MFRAIQNDSIAHQIITFIRTYHLDNCTSTMCIGGTSFLGQSLAMCPTFLQLNHCFSALSLSCSALDNRLPLALPAGLVVVAISHTASVFFGFLGPCFRFCTLVPVVVFWSGWHFFIPTPLPEFPVRCLSYCISWARFSFSADSSTCLPTSSKSWKQASIVRRPTRLW